MSIFKAIVIECDVEEQCANQVVWIEHPCTEHVALQEAINNGWAKRTTEERERTTVKHFCPTHK